MTDKIQDPWQRLLEAGSRPGGSVPCASSLPEPTPGFLETLRRQRAGLWKIVRALLWRKWSILFALASLLLFIVTLFLIKSMESPSPAIPRPVTPFLQQP